MLDFVWRWNLQDEGSPGTGLVMIALDYVLDRSEEILNCVELLWLRNNFQNFQKKKGSLGPVKATTEEPIFNKNLLMVLTVLTK